MPTTPVSPRSSASTSPPPEPVVAWTCPDCKRSFGAVGRGHICAPGLTNEEFIDGSPAFVRPVFERVDAHLRSVDEVAGGDLIVDPLSDKVLFKNGPTFAILEVKTKWVAIGFSLRRRLESGRLSRKVADYGTKFFHVVNATDADVVDDELRDWLTEAYHHGDPDAADAFRGADSVDVMAAPSNDDPMLPDDIDFEIAPPD